MEDEPKEANIERGLENFYRQSGSSYQRPLLYSEPKRLHQPVNERFVLLRFSTFTWLI